MMGSVIGFPAAMLSMIAEKGPFYCLNYYVTHLYLCITRCIRGKRVNDYDFNADGNPQKIGFLAQDLEWKLEPPQAKSPLRKVADDAFCYGTNSSGESLLVHIARKPNGEVRCSLLLQFPCGKKFTLPEEHLVQTESKEPYTFGSPRLKLQCLQPMRKWRVFFNGTLKEESTGSSGFVYKHVKFAFIWTASSEVFDFRHDMSDDVLAKAVAGDSSFPPIAHLEKIRDLLNNYEQPGMLLGTYIIEGEPEKDMYLWGTRGRYMGTIRELTKGDFLQVYGQFQTGATIHMEILNVPGMATKLIHGFVMHSNGFIDAIRELTEEKSDFEKERDFHLSCGVRRYNLIVKDITPESKNFQKEYEGATVLKSSNMLLNHIEGKGFIFEGLIQASPFSSLFKTQVNHSVQFALSDQQNPLTVYFKNTECQKDDLTGGKGSSLGKLYCLSKEIAKEANTPKCSFHVPKGIVVTTEAYKVFIQGKLESQLNEFEKTVWSNPDGDINKSCERIMATVKSTEFSNKIANAIDKNLEKVFGSERNDIKFAVRSSATGEDTEQMSAAGQMETFLGLKGLNQIIDAVRKCWASQFSFQAVEYKRRYGQFLNTPMAVVIQQMVPCDVAGVLFTCDPVTGDPSYVSITGNWGLGETVVSASAEPDTITLKRDIRNTLKPHSYQIGQKQKKMIMDGESGTKEVDVGTESSQLCLNEEKSLELGKIALKVEEHYGGPRDVEWGIANGTFYLFQARPVTSIDVDTDFEIKHILDNFIRMEREYQTRANIGEVMPGAISPLGIDAMTKVVNSCYARQGRFRTDGYCSPDVPYFHRLTNYSQNHGLIGFIDGLFRFGSSSDQSYVKSMMIAILGRTIDDSEMTKISAERFSHDDLGWVYNIGMKFKHLKVMYYRFFLKREARKFQKTEFPSMKGLSADEIVHQIGIHFHYLMNACNLHIHASQSTSNWNLNLLHLLAKAEEDFDTHVYSDFAYLLSTCSDVESADVPAAIQNLGITISKCIDTDKFKKMTAEDALKYLKSSQVAGEHFDKFIERHGHRCFKEFDVQSKPWDSKIGMLKLIKMLQGYASSDIKEIKKKDATTFSAIISHMHVNLDFISKLKLRYIIPNCRKAVSGREMTKSIWMKFVNKLRRCVQKLATQMVNEGYLPDEELIYYLCFEEINQLIKTRSPRLLTRAIRRQRVHPELEKLVFPEICVGIPKPLNVEEDVVMAGEGFVMQGIPVSQGVAKGVARVITDFEEVSSIQKDDILITYSTDIGWSPYFPLLSGVVTELGGLVSHGAVVAREYGLPCVVGLQGASKVFKSGDIVYLDGNKGILKKMEEK